MVSDSAGAAAFPAILQQLVSTGEFFMFEVTDDHRIHGSNGVFQRLMVQTLDELKGQPTLSVMRPGESMNAVYPEVLSLSARLRAGESLPSQPLAPWWFKVAYDYWVQAGDGTMYRDMAPFADAQMQPVLIIRARILAYQLGPPRNLHSRAARVVQPRLPGTGGDRIEVWCHQLEDLFEKVYDEDREDLRGKRNKDRLDMPTLGRPTLARLAYETKLAQGTWQKRLKHIAELEEHPDETAKDTLDRKYEEWQNEEMWGSSSVRKNLT